MDDAARRALESALLELSPEERALVKEAFAHDDAPVRAARKFIEVVGELHALGYEGLHLDAGLAPSGCYWRGRVFAACEPALTTPSYSSGAAFRMLFELEHAEALTLRAIAEHVLERFPELARAGKRADRAYAAWYEDMLRVTAPNGCIYYSADFPLPASGVGVLASDASIDAPPGHSWFRR
jgi:hypothetical protein